MSEYGAADLNLGITEKLAGYLADLQFEDLPDDVIHECRRGILDWLGCALAGSEHATLDTLTGVLGAISPNGGSTVIGAPLLAIGVLIALFMTAGGAALDSTYRAVLYEYAQNGQTSGFSKEILDSSFRPKGDLRGSSW